jgi:hypothetical protein
MKTIRLIFFIILMIACTRKDDNYMSAGTITGPDYRMCACCGGWFISIKDVPYLFDALPKDAGIDLATQSFPLQVMLDWETSGTSCSLYNRIKVLRVKKI